MQRKKTPKYHKPFFSSLPSTILSKLLFSTLRLLYLAQLVCCFWHGQPVLPLWHSCLSFRDSFTIWAIKFHEEGVFPRFIRRLKPLNTRVLNIHQVPCDWHHTSYIILPCCCHLLNIIVVDDIPVDMTSQCPAMQMILNSSFNFSFLPLTKRFIWLKYPFVFPYLLFPLEVLPKAKFLGLTHGTDQSIRARIILDDTYYILDT